MQAPWACMANRAQSVKPLAKAAGGIAAGGIDAAGCDVSERSTQDKVVQVMNYGYGMASLTGFLTDGIDQFNEQDSSLSHPTGARVGSRVEHGIWRAALCFSSVTTWMRTSYIPANKLDGALPPM